VRYSSLERGFPAGNPIASALVIIIGSLAIAASIVVGFSGYGGFVAKSLGIRHFMRNKPIPAPAATSRL
jgi:hypothetical protein